MVVLFEIRCAWMIFTTLCTHPNLTLLLWEYKLYSLPQLMSKFHLSMTNNSFCHRFMKYDFPTYTHALNIQKQLSSAVQRRIRFLLQLESFISHIRLNVVRKKINWKSDEKFVCSTDDINKETYCLPTVLDCSEK